MTKEQKEQIREARKAWLDARSATRQAEEALERASSGVLDAKYDWEQWESKEALETQKERVELAHAQEQEARRDLERALQEAGIIS